MNLPAFSFAFLRAHWKLIAAAIVGAVLCWPVASCQGRRSAEAHNSAKIVAAAAKVREAAAKAETAAVLADMARTANTAKEADELREIIRETKSEAGVGPATTAVLNKLRSRHSSSSGSSRD